MKNQGLVRKRQIRGVKLSLSKYFCSNEFSAFTNVNNLNSLQEQQPVRLMAERSWCFLAITNYRMLRTGIGERLITSFAICPIPDCSLLFCSVIIAIKSIEEFSINLIRSDTTLSVFSSSKL